MATQLYLLELFPQSSAHAVSNTLGLDFIVAVTKPAQSPTIEEMEMTAIWVNTNVRHILLKHRLSVRAFPLNTATMPYVYYYDRINSEPIIYHLSN